MTFLFIMQIFFLCIVYSLGAEATPVHSPTHTLSHTKVLTSTQGCSLSWQSTVCCFWVAKCNKPVLRKWADLFLSRVNSLVLLRRISGRALTCGLRVEAWVQTLFSPWLPVWPRMSHLGSQIVSIPSLLKRKGLQWSVRSFLALKNF